MASMDFGRVASGAPATTINPIERKEMIINFLRNLTFYLKVERLSLILTLRYFES